MFALLVFAAASCDKPAPPPGPPASRPATSRPATRPHAIEAIAAPPPATVLDVLRLDDPAYPTTRPLDLPADLDEAAKIVLDQNAYADASGDLWLRARTGRPAVEALAGPVVDHTAVTRERVRYVARPDDGGPASAVVTLPDGRLAAVWPGGQSRPSEHTFDNLPDAYRDLAADTGRGVVYYKIHVFGSEADFTRAQPFEGGVVVPSDGGAVLLFSPDLSSLRVVELPRATTAGPRNPPVLAAADGGVWAWSPGNDNAPGGRPVFIDAAGPHPADAAAGWPDNPVELVPLADGSVLVVAGGVTDAGRPTPVLKLIAASEKPPTPAFLKAIEPLARQLADPDPLRREAAQRQIEMQGPAALSVLASIKDQLPPEAQTRIETLLGERFAPTLAGLRLLPGTVRTLARFPGGGSVMRFDGGGTLDADDTQPERSVIPATVLVRPGYPPTRIDPESVCDFVPGTWTIQWVGGELLLGDPKLGPRRWVGNALLPPLLPPVLADFDTVVTIDARRRWLLTSARRLGKTLLIDPTLPDTTPKLPVWTVAADAVGHVDGDWPAVRRGERVFVLDRDRWRVADPGDFHAGPPTATTRPADATVAAGGDTIRARTPDGGVVKIELPQGSADAKILATADRLLAYTPDGVVRRFDLHGGRATPVATFSGGVPAAAEAVWLDAAGRLVMATDKSLSVGFPDGRVGRLRDVILNLGQ